MDVRKFFEIAWKDVKITFGDRNLVLIMFAAPLAITLIMGAAFSGLASTGTSDVPIRDIPTVIVNEDQGAQIFLQRLNYGDIITDILIPKADAATEERSVLQKMIKAEKVTREEAISRVNAGKASAAVIIPADFTESLNPTLDQPKQTSIEIYRDAGSPFNASIVSSVVRGIVNQLTSGSVAIYAAGQADPLLKIQGQAITEAMQTAEAPITLNAVSVEGVQQNSQNINPISYFGPAMAVFFLTFTMAGGATSIIEEQRDWTLQRLISTPTRAMTILAGKLGGTYATGVVQLTILILIMAMLPPLLGINTSMWGNNPLAIALLTLATVAAACGLGTLLAALARTAEQANTWASAVNIVLGLLGGTFFDITSVPVLKDVSKITLNSWAINGYSTLAATSDLGAIVPNIIVLLLMFVVFFGIGVVVFQRRLRV